MSIEDIIRQEASEIAGRQLQRAAHFQDEYLEIQAQADNRRAKRDAARAAPERLANFAVKVGEDYCCPSCWIERNARAALMPKPSPHVTISLNASAAGIWSLSLSNISARFQCPTEPKGMFEFAWLSLPLTHLDGFLGIVVAMVLTREIIVRLNRMSDRLADIERALRAQSQ
jgi:hypothetical protein